MSEDPFAEPTAGTLSPFVGSFNTVSRSLEALRNLKNPFGQPTPSQSGGVDQRLPVPHSSVLVRNDTGASLDALSVLKLGATLQGITHQPHDIFRLPAFAGSTPGASSDQFCILLEPCPAGHIVKAAIRGVAVCYVTVGNTSHKWAAPGTSSSQLVSGDTGPARILSTLTGTGRQLCAVLIDDRGDRLVRVEVDETAMNGEPATVVNIYAADEPTTSTPVIQMTVANNYSGGNEGALIAVYPLGTAGSAAVTQSIVTNGSTTTSITETWNLNSQTANVAITESGGDIVQTWSSGQQLIASAATVTGFGGVGTLVATALAQSNVATVNFTGIGTYRWYKIVCYDVQAKNGGGATLWLRTSTDGGSTYDSGAGDYADHNAGGSTAQIAVSGLSTVGDDSSSGNASSFEITLFNPSGTAVDKTVVVAGVVHISGSSIALVTTAGARKSSADIDAIRLLMSTGNLNGSFLLYGYN